MAGNGDLEVRGPEACEHPDNEQLTTTVAENEGMSESNMSTTSTVLDVKKVFDQQKFLEEGRRPLNSFMLWKLHESKNNASLYHDIPMNKLNAILGAKWKSMTEDERKPWVDAAAEYRVKHSKYYPDYNWFPNGRPKRYRKSRFRCRSCDQEPCLCGEGIEHMVSYGMGIQRAEVPMLSINDAVCESERWYAGSRVGRAGSIGGYSATSDEYSHESLLTSDSGFYNHNSHNMLALGSAPNLTNGLTHHQNQPEFGLRPSGQSHANLNVRAALNSGSYASNATDDSGFPLSMDSLHGRAVSLQKDMDLVCRDMPNVPSHNNVRPDQFFASLAMGPFSTRPDATPPQRTVEAFRPPSFIPSNMGRNRIRTSNASDVTMESNELACDSFASDAFANHHHAQHEEPIEGRFEMAEPISLGRSISDFQPGYAFDPYGRRSYTRSRDDMDYGPRGMYRDHQKRFSHERLSRPRGLGTSNEVPSLGGYFGSDRDFNQYDAYQTLPRGRMNRSRST
eukprot:Colp12_sorted_trinity150504_noHs@28813